MKTLIVPRQTQKLRESSPCSQVSSLDSVPTNRFEMIMGQNVAGVAGMQARMTLNNYNEVSPQICPSRIVF
jgi:hypothetical protein